PPLIAEKVFLSLYVISFPLGFLYFLGAVDPAKKPLALLSFGFVYNYLFMLGFFNFVFSVPLAFWTLGYFWKRRSHLTRGNVVVLNLMLLLVYVAHLISYVVVVGAIGFLAAVQFQKDRLGGRDGVEGPSKKNL